MASSTLNQLAPLAAPLPPPPEGEFFTPEQWQTLLSIVDTVIPTIRKEKRISNKTNEVAIADKSFNATLDHLQKTVVSAPNVDDLEDYLAEKASDNAAFIDLLKRTLILYAPEDARKGLAILLSALNTRAGSLLLTGYTTPIRAQPIHIRTAILHSWRQSYLTPLQGAYKTLTFVAKGIWLKTSPSICRITGFTKVPHEYKPGPQFQYEFLQFSAGDEPEVIETDVVIVGSGFGGAVSAANLAAAGHNVIVVEKSYHYPSTSLPMAEAEGGIHLFENGGFTTTDDGSMFNISGSTWGGGGTVNWSASLQTQSFVRREWAEDFNLPFFATAEFQKSLDKVSNHMGVSAKAIRHNHGSNVLLEGARKLGYTAQAVPQNTLGHEHYCGYCMLGCGMAQKQGPAVSWLPGAARDGARFIEGYHVERVLFEQTRGKKTAVGVKGLWTSRSASGGVDGPISERTTRELIIKAKKVILSCGALWSPLVLLSSGLKNPQIGRNLHLHPCNFIYAVYAEDVRPWEGGILTSAVTNFENLDGNGYGVKLEGTCMLPSLSMVFINWASGLDFKTSALKYRHLSGFISLARDRDSGRVYPDPITGKPRIAYTPSAYDRRHILEGVIAEVKMAYITGATEIHVCIAGVEPFIRSSAAQQASSSSSPDVGPGITDPVFQAWLAHIRKVGNAPPGGIFAGAHQMGSNRMSATPAQGVVDPKGRVWGVDSLYVADASVFPSASGVNPMLTVLAISDWISMGIAKELREIDAGNCFLVPGLSQCKL